jgi:hypothetical protein
MNVARTFRILGGSLAASLVIGALGTATADAKPVKPGPVTGLTASAVGGSTVGTYDVTSSWNASTSATKYKVAITKGGVTLASATITTTSWNPTVTTTPGSASLAVTPVAVHRKGATARLTFTMADVTAPQGSYSSSWDNNTGVATITQDSLTDDSPVAQVTRTVDWNDGTSVQAWTTGTTLNHTYPLVEQRYVPTVTLEDAAHNVTVVDVPAVVINDLEAPSGTFAVAPGTAWATLTEVTVSQSALADNWSPAANITRSVDWGDGSTPSDWTVGTTISHIYTSGGTFSPVVTITDEAANAAPVATSDVTVTVDAVAPVVKLLLPKTHRHSVKAWRTLRGKATDTNGTGVKHVRLRAVEKRGTKWFGYRPATKTWVKAATRARAFKRSRAFTRTTSLQHLWSAHLTGLRKGTLVYKVSAVDLVHNASTPITHKATLTKR